MKIRLSALAALTAVLVIIACAERTRQERNYSPASLVTVDEKIVVLPETPVGSTEEGVRANCPTGVSTTVPSIDVGPSGGHLLRFSWDFTGKEPSEWEVTMLRVRPDGGVTTVGRMPYAPTEVREFRGYREMEKGSIYRFELAARPVAPHAFGRMIFRTFVVDLRGIR